MLVSCLLWTGCCLCCLLGCLVGLFDSLIGGYWFGCLIANSIDVCCDDCLHGICNSVDMLAFAYFGFGLSLFCCGCILEYTVFRWFCGMVIGFGLFALVGLFGFVCLGVCL